jgi:hypothetical protein
LTTKRGLYRSAAAPPTADSRGDFSPSVLSLFCSSAFGCLYHEEIDENGDKKVGEKTENGKLKMKSS